jgi:hypothetical protein
MYFCFVVKKIYWADSLIAVSSEARFVNASKTAFKGIQALGKPNIMPDFGV